MLLPQLLPSANSTQSSQRRYLSLFVFMAAVLTRSLRRSQLNGCQTMCAASLNCKTVVGMTSPGW